MARRGAVQDDKRVEELESALRAVTAERDDLRNRQWTPRDQNREPEDVNIQNPPLTEKGVYRVIRYVPYWRLNQAEAEAERLRSELAALRQSTEATHDERCQGRTEPFNTRDYRLAPAGEGPHAGTWEDKPHRLIYDLCSYIESQSTEADAKPVAYVSGIELKLDGNGKWFKTRSQSFEVPLFERPAPVAPAEIAKLKAELKREREGRREKETTGRIVKLGRGSYLEKVAESPSRFGITTDRRRAHRFLDDVRFVRLTTPKSKK